MIIFFFFVLDIMKDRVVHIVSGITSLETWYGYAWFPANLEVLVISRSMRAVCLLHVTSLSLSVVLLL